MQALGFQKKHPCKEEIKHQIEELLCAPLVENQPGSSRLTQTQTLQHSERGNMIYSANRRRAEDTELLGPTGFHSGGLAPGLHHPPHITVYF